LPPFLILQLIMFAPELNLGFRFAWGTIQEFDTMNLAGGPPVQIHPGSWSIRPYQGDAAKDLELSCLCTAHNVL
jgi:hypothetical protein